MQCPCMDKCTHWWTLDPSHCRVYRRMKCVIHGSPSTESGLQSWIIDHGTGDRVHECMQLSMDKPGIYRKSPSILGSDSSMVCVQHLPSARPVPIPPPEKQKRKRKKSPGRGLAGCSVSALLYCQNSPDPTIGCPEQASIVST